MKTEDKIQIMLDRGYIYDPKSGLITGPSGTILKKKEPTGYGVVGGMYHEGKKIYVRAHQFAFFSIYGYLPECIDHIDENKSNNRIDNLRAANKRLNGYNRSKSVGYRFNGFSYVASIVIDGVNTHLGSYRTPDEAKNSYETKKAELIKMTTK